MAWPVIVLGAGAVAFLGWVIKGKKRKVFFSYHAAGDGRYKNLVKAWSKNEKFSIEFDDVSTDVSINSTDANYLKRKIKQRIKDCDVFLVLIGKSTHKREWVAWEIEAAKECGKRILAIKEKREFQSPKSLLSSGALWVYGFSERKIRDGLESFDW